MAHTAFWSAVSLAVHSRVPPPRRHGSEREAAEAVDRKCRELGIPEKNKKLLLKQLKKS